MFEGAPKECIPDECTKIPEEIIDLVIFMCETWSKINTWVYTDKHRDILNYPVLQGIRNQLNIEKIAKLPYTRTNLHFAADYILKQIPEWKGEGEQHE